jgi:hypothetical protein
MTVFAFGSVKGAPGVSTTVLGLGCVWPRPAVLIEADPAGGLLLNDLGLDRLVGAGLLDAALHARRGNIDLLSHTIALTADERIRVLPGLTDPGHVAAVADHWTALATAIIDLAATGEIDALIDCGRLHAGSPWPLFAAADAIGLLIRPRAGDVALLNGWLPPLRDRLSSSTQTMPQLGVVSVGNRPYGARELAYGLTEPLVGMITDDGKEAQRLLAGDRRLNGRSNLLRSISALIPNLSELAAGRDAERLTPQHKEASSTVAG